MFAAATPAPKAPALAPISVAASSEIALAPPIHTTLRVRVVKPAVLIGSPAVVKGRLSTSRPTSVRDRPIVLQALRRHGWRAVARSHTGPRGGFRVTYRPRSLGSTKLRARFAGRGRLK